MANYLDYAGLQTLVGKVKEGDKAVKDYVGAIPASATETTVISYLENKITGSEFSGEAKDVTISDAGSLITATNVEDALQEIATSVNGKIAKVTSATNGNFAGLDADGNVTDSGKKAADFEVAGAAKAVQGGDASYTGTVKSVDDKIGVQKAEGVEATGLYKYVDDSIAGADISGKIQTEIQKLDVEDTAETGKFVTAVSETDGKITVSRAALAASDIPDLTLSKITDAGTAAAKTANTTALADADAEEATVNNNLTTAAQVVKYVKDKTAAVTGVLHFRGVVNTTSEVTDPAQGDVVIIKDSTKEYIYDGSAWVEFGDESAFVLKTATIAGVDLQDNITKEELLTALNVADGAQVNVVEGIQVNGTDLTATDKKVNVTVATGSANGNISVNGTDVAVKGLGSAAYTDAPGTISTDEINNLFNPPADGE